MGESRIAYRVLDGRPERKRPLGRPRRRWKDNIKMDLREVGYDDREWINLAQDRAKWRAYVRAAMNLRDIKNYGRGCTAYTRRRQPMLHYNGYATTSTQSAKIQEEEEDIGDVRIDRIVLQDARLELT
ncbi:hypothetical protein ANN_04207 [Periplaneta americana]|uniref:Uncharacterized protein n=1 Tax=Periplaneta americana TaxID=6978 RepID=A0ABQ8T7X7_PERAM|nr:hypothetical protein ANN_04207 [Periplaneta americana]